MRKITEVLRLRHDLGFGYRQIARSCLVGLGTVSDYLKRAAAAGLKWPLPEGMTEDQLNELLFGCSETGRAAKPLPDFSNLHEQLRTHKHLTLQLLWDEYRQSQPDGYGYSRFCELYSRYRRKLDLVLRQEHTPGEKMFVDWAGDKVPIQDASSGQIHAASLFVSVLGYSSYTYAEVTADEQMEAGLSAHPCTGILSRRAASGRSRQHQNRRDQGLPLRPGSQPHLPGNGAALRHGCGPGAPAAAARQNLRFILHLVQILQRSRLAGPLRDRHDPS